MSALEWKKICCPIDFSKAARHACETAADLSGRYGAELILLHVEARGEEWSETTAKEFVADAQKLGAAQVRLVRESGEPSARISEYAKKHEISLIVMGTHGRTGRAASLVGSVAESVVRSAPCPVLIVK